MIRLTRQLTVERPVTEAFTYLADFSSTEQWDVNVNSAEKLTPGKPGKGSRFLLEAKTGIQTIPIEYQITEFETHEYLQLQGQARGFTVTDSFSFTPLSKEQTNIHYQMEITLNKPLEKLTKRFPAFLNKIIDSALAGLARALNDYEEPIEQPNLLADKLVIPGMVNFTRRGYLAAKKHWKGLAANLTGKNAVITGATSGLGKVTAMSLSKMNANVLIVARNPKKAEKVKQEIFTETGKHIHVVIADLELMSDTLKATQEISNQFGMIDILVNNAGALFNERQTTPEGFERSFALLLLSPFVLTETLLPNLQAAPHARVINVSSGGMYTQPVVLSDLNYEQGHYDGPKAYARAKRGLVDLTEVWAEQHSGITFNAMHPGWADTPAVALSLPGFYKVTKPFLRTPKEGADTILWLAAAKEAQTPSGRFWLDRQPHPTGIFPGTQSSHAKQLALHQKLLELKQSLKEPAL